MRANSVMAQAAFWLIISTVAAAQDKPQPATPALSAADEQAIRAIVLDSSADRPNPHVSPSLDWENAFGIRYHDLKKRDAFYAAIVKPLQLHDTGGTLELKVRLVTPDVAVADEYWHEAGQLDVKTRKPGPDRWGRTTYILTHANGTWTEVLERVADLRLSYYHHYDSLPPAAPMPPAMLARYAGVYSFTDNGARRTIAVDGNHLTVASPTKTRVAIPQSNTDFLLFDPNDLAEYAKLQFSPDAKTVTLRDETGEIITTLARVR
jgi:hypothetical protein